MVKGKRKKDKPFIIILSQIPSRNILFAIFNMKNKQFLLAKDIAKVIGIRQNGKKSNNKNTRI